MALIPPSSEFFPLVGGFDLTTVPILSSPGTITAGHNLETIAGIQGYSRLDGYEGISGLPLPSDATVSVVTIAPGSFGTAIIGDEFSTSIGKKAYPTHTIEITGGELLSLYVPGEVRSFPGETFTNGANSFTILSVSESLQALADDDKVTHFVAAVEIARDLVEDIPGSGQVRGIFRLKGVVYGFRDNLAGTACELYKTTSTGWQKVLFASVLYFEQASNSVDNSTEFEVGETLTTATGTATILSCTRWAGVWDSAQPVADRSTGYLVVEPVSGYFVAGAAISAGNVDGVSTTTADPITLNPGGAYDVKINNFYVDPDKESSYGADGKNFAFEFDGTTYNPIIPEFYTDSFPTDVLDHQDMLFLAYPGGTWLQSALVGVDGSVRVFNTVFGAKEWNTGETITSTKAITSSSVAVTCEKSIWILQGEVGVHTWRKFNANIGAVRNSVGGFGDIVFMYASSIHSLKTTSAYGDFMSLPIAEEIQPFLDSEHGKVTASLICKKKSQYRVFYEDGYGLCVSFKGNKVSASTVFKFPIPVLSVWAEAGEEGVEYMYFGSEDGRVYKLDSGNTFDDLEITGFARFQFYHYKSPLNLKQFLNFKIQMQSPVLLTGNTFITNSLDFSNGDPNYPVGITRDFEVTGGGGMYDANFVYGGFVYSGQVVSELKSDEGGQGVNMSILINFRTRYDKKFTLNSCLVNFIKLGVVQ